MTFADQFELQRQEEYSSFDEFFRKVLQLDPFATIYLNLEKRPTIVFTDFSIYTLDNNTKGVER